MKKRKALIPFLLFITVLVIFGMRPGAFAEETVQIDYDKKGSISVILNSDGVPLSGAGMAVYRIAEAYESDGVLKFKYTESVSYDIPLSELQTPASIERLFGYIKSAGVSPLNVAYSDNSGRIVFSDLPLGVYLVVQTTSVEGFADCSPFLIVIPETENGIVNYDVDASPKTELAHFIDISVKKVWNDDNAEHEPVKVRLYNGEEAIGEAVVLSQANNWTYTWKDMPQSDSYSVAETDVPLGYYASYNRSGYDFTVTNSTVLINTGQHKAMVPILAVSGAFFFLLGWIRSYGGKVKKEKEN